MQDKIELGKIFKVFNPIQPSKAFFPISAVLLPIVNVSIYLHPLNWLSSILSSFKILTLFKLLGTSSLDNTPPVLNKYPKQKTWSFHSASPTNGISKFLIRLQLLIIPSPIRLILDGKYNSSKTIQSLNA